MPRTSADDPTKGFTTVQVRDKKRTLSDPVPLVLASGSPRRADLLRGVGVSIVVAPVDCDETPHPGEAPVAYARRIADAKLAAALARDPDARPVLAADTVVWHDGGEPIGKPASRTEAAAMIRRLVEGPPHNVTTAWALARRDGTVHREHETTRVFMRRLSPEAQAAYLDTDEWVDKAGAYGIQGFAAAFVTRVDGSYTNVVGLPLAQVVAALEAEVA